MVKLFLCLFLFFAVQMAGAIAALFGGGTPSAPNYALLALFQLAASLAAAALLVLTPLTHRPFRTVSPVVHRRSLLVAPLCLLAAFGLNYAVAPLALPDAGSTAMLTTLLATPAGLLLVCLAGPLLEELVFRAGIQFHLMRKGLHPLLSATVAATTFAAVHGNLAQGIPAFLMGCLFGLVYARCGHVWLCLAAHVLNNCVAAFLLLHPSADVAMLSLPAVPLALGGALLAAACTWAVWRLLP